jgi:glycosyltransferase involved in cell wall biosynthesis
MNVLQINQSDIIGGAARASYRIHHALRDNGVNSMMQVSHAAANDWTITGPHSKFQKGVDMMCRVMADIVSGTLKTDETTMHSPALFSSGMTNYVSTSNYDVVNLHWVNNEMMSITDIGNLLKPVVWTLHDMWAFCGAEHYTESFRWRDGYLRTNRPVYERGFDLNRWVWTRKKKNWKKHIQIVCPSKWLADRARESVLMRDWPITVIPNPIDTDKWCPLEKKYARKLLKLPEDKPLLLFGAYDGTNDPRKGFYLLRESLTHLHGVIDDLELVVFGQNKPKNKPDVGFPIHFIGHLHDDLSLRVLYSAVDVLVNPARQEAFGQTASEAHACATPVVAFDNTGLSDIVDHKITGYLARAFDVEDFARGIAWVIEKERDAQGLIVGGVHNDTDGGITELGSNARIRTIDRFSYPVVSDKYHKIYQKVISDHGL